MIGNLGDRHLWAEVNILDGVKELSSLFHRALEGLASGDESGSSGALVDDGRFHRILKVMGSGGAAGVDETGTTHEAVDDLITAEVDRVIRGELCVDALVELAVAGTAGIECLVAAIVLRELLFDDVRLDRDAKVVGLTGEVGGEMVILVLLEGIVAEVTPEDGRHAEFVGMMKSLGHLDDFVAGILTAKIDGGTHCRSTHVIGFLDGAEHDFASNVRIGQELVMVDLHQEGNVVGVFAGDGTKDAKGGGDGIAASLDGEFHDVLGIEVDWILCKAGAGGVFDTLVNRKDGKVAGICQASGAVHALKVGQDAGIPITANVDAVHKVGTRKVQKVFGYRFALVIEEGVGFGSEVVFNVVDHDSPSSGQKKGVVQKIPSGRPYFERNCYLVGGLCPLDVLLLDPGHAGAELLAHLLDGVLLASLEEGVILLLATLCLGNPILGELAGLDVLEGGLHPLLDGSIDNLGPDYNITILGGLGDGETHAANSRLVDHVNDELQLVEHFEIGHLGLVSGLDESLESGLNKCRGTAAKHGLLAEEIGLGLFLEAGFENTAAGSADTLGPGEGGLLGVAALVLMNGDERGDTLAFLILATHGVAGALGGDHDDVNVLGWLDRLEVNRETVAEEEGMTRVEIRGDVFLVHFWNDEVGNRDKDHVGLLDCLGCVENRESKLLGDLTALALRVKTDDHLDAAFLEVQGVCVSLGTEADHGAGFSLEELQIGVFAGVDFGGHGLVVVCWLILVRGLFGTGEGDLAGAGQFGDPKLLHQGQEFVDLALGTGDLDGKALRLHVDDLCPEDIADLHDFGTGLGIGLHPDEDEFPIDIVGFAEVLDADDVHELVELLVDLIKHLVIAPHHDGHAGGFGVERRADVQGVYIETAAAEHTRDAGEDAELVFDEDGDGVTHGCRS